MLNAHLFGVQPHAAERYNNICKEDFQRLVCKLVCKLSLITNLLLNSGTTCRDGTPANR